MTLNQHMELQPLPCFETGQSDRKYVAKPGPAAPLQRLNYRKVCQSQAGSHVWGCVTSQRRTIVINITSQLDSKDKLLPASRPCSWTGTARVLSRAVLPRLPDVLFLSQEGIKSQEISRDSHTTFGGDSLRPRQ